MTMRKSNRRNRTPLPSVEFDKIMEEESREISRASECRTQELGCAEPQCTDPKPTGLALSGGGIRSATFNLGLIQALAKHDLLHRFDYLSTVSGGGYIGGFFLALIKRKGSLKEALKSLKDLGSKEIEYLRDYSNFLTPRTGLLSSDTWTFISTILRNLILNLLLLGCALSTVLIIPMLIEAIARQPPIPLHWLSGLHWGMLAAFALLACFGFWQVDSSLSPVQHEGKRSPHGSQLAVALSLLLTAAVLSTLLRVRPERFELPWIESSGRVNLIFGLCAAVVLALLLVASRSRRGEPLKKGPMKIQWAIAAAFVGGVLFAGMSIFVAERNPANAIWVIFGLPSIVAVLYFCGVLYIGLVGFDYPPAAREWWGRLGGRLLVLNLTWIVFSGIAICSSEILMFLREPMLASLFGSGWLGSTITCILTGWKGPRTDRQSSPALRFAVAVAPYGAMLGIVMALAVGLGELFQAVCSSESRSPAAIHAIGLTAFLVLTCALADRFNVNEFSMHNFYRNRLAQTYLGASNVGRSQQADPFTQDLELMLEEFRVQANYSGPYPIINCTLNLTRGQRLSWQKRRGASWVFTPLYTGSSAISDGRSFRPTSSCDPPVPLATAMAISGAAVSPNMGYHSSSALAFLMTVLNVRLGWWFANPSRPRPKRRSRHEAGGLHLLYELFGWADDTRRYVHLSDGGHFEVLGLYELIKRRCSLILVSDVISDRGSEFEELALAIEKCRRDLGAEIGIRDFELSELRRCPQSGYSPSHFKEFSIRYKDNSCGRLIYIKASLTGDEPADVSGYAAANPQFPHQSTLDQFFDESQFESYRMLGEHIGNDVAAALAKRQGKSA